MGLRWNFRNQPDNVADRVGVPGGNAVNSLADPIKTWDTPWPRGSSSSRDTRQHLFHSSIA